MLNLIANVVFSIVIAALAVYAAKLYRDKKRILNSITQLTADYLIVRGELEKSIQASQQKTVEQSDGFLKFVSDSRDWAFSYIETVQDELQKFTSTVGPVIKYLNTYGTAVASPHDDSIKIISEAYKDLESLLPQDQ